MPKRTKKISKVKKPRSSKRKFKRTLVRRKKIVRKKGGKRKWYKKWKGKKAVYKFANSQGLKFSRYVSLAEFLTLPFSDICGFMLASLRKYDDNRFYLGDSFSCTDTFRAEVERVLGRYCTIPSTSVMINHNESTPFGDWSKFKFHAFNPVLNSINLGPLYSQMLMSFDKFKYVGVQVKWRPNVKFVSTALPTWKMSGVSIGGTNANGIIHLGDGTPGDYAATIYPTAQVDNVWINTIFPSPFPSSSMGPVESGKLSFTGTVPPTFRLWVNFQKDGYEPIDAFTERIVDAVYTGPVESKSIYGTRFLERCCFDDRGNFLPSYGQVKCFNLNKPFKFFVRPKVQIRSFEPISNELVSNNYEASSSYQSILLHNMPNNDVLPGKLVRPGWLNVGSMQPFVIYPEGQIDASNSEQFNARLVSRFLERGYYDPVLFSYYLTCDNLGTYEYVQPFSSVSSNRFSPYSASYPSNFRLFGNQYLEGFGKFKVTFYCKFKGRRKNIMVLNSQAILAVTTNAIGDRDNPDAMQTEQPPGAGYTN